MIDLFFTLLWSELRRLAKEKPGAATKAREKALEDKQSPHGLPRRRPDAVDD